MSEEGDTLEGLFAELDPDCEVFFFDDIEVDVSIQDGLQVIYHFRYVGQEEHRFKSKLFIQHVQLALNTAAYRTLFSIGMCVLPWFWMGFATRRVVISARTAQLAELTEDMMRYWREAYAHILAEFVYVNRLNFDEVDLQYEAYEKEQREVQVAGEPDSHP
ncbi:hypothetical protein EON63_09730 [archaeon]|nr:MAG: hypothetical protein EON63_09730 [archaeon]